MRRVVVTGLGMVTPLACGVEQTWSRLLDGKSGARKITHFNVEDLPTKIAANVPRGDGSDGTFNPDHWVDAKEQRRVDDFIIFGLTAAQQAWDDAKLVLDTEEKKCRAGVLIGSGIGGLPGIAEAAVTLHEKGPRKISPFFITGRLINLVSGQASIRFGLKGPNSAVVTACSTGAHAIGDAARMIALDDADVMMAGGAEAAISRLGIAGFNACRALSTAFNDQPERGSRPYDKDRDGFVMGEGAGVVILEELEHAKRRGAKIYAEVKGYGATCDAYHITKPSPDGEGARRAMRDALADAHLAPTDIDYLNAHATSTPAGDVEEARAIEAVFGDHARPGGRLWVSSTKGVMGHLLGGAGAAEAAMCLLAMRDGKVPPTANLEDQDPEVHLDCVPLAARDRELRHVMSNSFGFGGTNVTLVFSRYVG